MFQLYFLIGGEKITLYIFSLMFVLSFHSCSNTKQHRQIDEDYYSRNLDFRDRLMKYKIDVNQNIFAHLKNHHKSLKRNNQLQYVYTVYASLDRKRNDCNLLKNVIEEKDILNYISFSPYAAYTMILNEENEYIASVWDNGSNVHPKQMNSYSKELNLINEYVNRNFELVIRISDCKSNDYFLGYRDQQVLFYKYRNEDLVSLTLEDFQNNFDR
ncbi:MAG: hypothetical protein AAFO82_10050 [Bacteroidota bacterium]